MASDRGNASFRPDAWVSAGIGVLLSLACFVAAIYDKNWTLGIAGLGFAAFVPGRYFSPAPFFQPLRTGYVSAAQSFISMPRWGMALDAAGVALFLGMAVFKWVA